MAGLSSSLPFWRQRRGSREDRIGSQAVNSPPRASAGGTLCEEDGTQKTQGDNRAVGDPEVKVHKGWDLHGSLW